VLLRELDQLVFEIVLSELFHFLFCHHGVGFSVFALDLFEQLGWTDLVGCGSELFLCVILLIVVKDLVQVLISARVQNCF
jgi:hypothetical protein